MTRRVSLQRFKWNDPGHSGQHTDLGGRGGEGEASGESGRGCGRRAWVHRCQWAWGGEGGGPPSPSLLWICLFTWLGWAFIAPLTPGQCPVLLETRGAEGSGPYLPAVKSVIGALLTSAGEGGALGGSSRKWAWFPPVAEPPPGSGIVRTGSDFQTPRLRAFRFSPELKNKGSRSHSGVRLCAISRTVAHLVLCLWNSPGKNTGVGAVPLSRGSS